MTMKTIKQFILDLFLSAILGLTIGLIIQEKKIEAENERLYNDIVQIEWVKSAKEINPLNKIEMGIENGSK